MKTVLGEIRADALGVTLPHEHICCYNEYALKMMGERYLDKDALRAASVAYLKEMKKKYSLSTVFDCTPVNIGRDIDLLRRVSEESEVNIVTSTGFYYTDEPTLYSATAEMIAEYILTDAKATNAGIIKCAVEREEITPFLEKVLRACAMAHRECGLPIVMHSNARNKNARAALEILFSEEVKPSAVTVGHLSDTEEVDYIKEIAAHGCFIGLDRLRADTSEEYISKKLFTINELIRSGYGEKILLSHDSLFFSGFDKQPKINEKPRLAYLFEEILPRLPEDIGRLLTVDNPARAIQAK